MYIHMSKYLYFNISMYCKYIYILDAYTHMSIAYMVHVIRAHVDPPGLISRTGAL
jgi:hypothetical protein